MKIDELTVGDIMQKDVITVQPDVSVREFTRLLSERGITGVPVVTWSGTVVGVVSATDVVRLAAEEPEMASVQAWSVNTRNWSDEDEDPALSSFFQPETPLPSWDWSNLAEHGFDEFTVEDIMTPVSFMMPPDASLRELASFLSKGRIHRAVVTEEGRLVGIVTTMDILLALAGDN